MKKIKKAAKNIATFILAGFFTLLLMEGYIRYGEIQSLSNFEVDSVHGKRLRAHVPMLYLMEGFYMGEVNAYGYLGPGYAPKKEPGTYRIALLGDSYIEGFQVFDRHHFRSILEDTLNQTRDEKVQVLNFGRSGFTLADMYVYYKEFAAEFNPDLFLIFVHNNDFFEKSYQTLLPSVSLENDTLSIKRPFLKSAAYTNYNKTSFYRENSTYLRMVNNGAKLIKEGVLPELLLGKFYQKNGGEKKQGEGRESEKQEQEAPEMPLIHKAILRALAAEVNVIFVLADKPTSEISKFFESTDAQIISMWEEFHAMQEEGINPNYWEATGKYGHWNQEAHKKIARLLSGHFDK